MQQSGQLAQEPAKATVEQTRDSTEQVAQEVARTALGDDVEHDLIQVNDETQKVQVERTQVEVQDVAGGGERLRRRRGAARVEALDLKVHDLAVRLRPARAPRSWWSRATAS